MFSRWVGLTLPIIPSHPGQVDRICSKNTIGVRQIVAGYFKTRVLNCGFQDVVDNVFPLLSTKRGKILFETSGGPRGSPQEGGNPIKTIKTSVKRKEGRPGFLAWLVPEVLFFSSSSSRDCMCGQIQKHHVELLLRAEGEWSERILCPSTGRSLWWPRKAKLGLHQES